MAKAEALFDDPVFAPEARLKGFPLGNRVLVRPMVENDVSPGGIIIPDVAKDRPEMGLIVAVGPGRETVRGGEIELSPMRLSVGDFILFSRYTGIDIKLNGEQMIVISEDDVLLKVEEETE